MKKTVWKPTKEELEEMGLKESDKYSSFISFSIDGYANVNAVGYSSSGNWFIEDRISQQGVNFFPESRQDVETLIRLMTQ